MPCPYSKALKAELISVLLGVLATTGSAAISRAGDLKRLALHTTIEIANCETFDARMEFVVGRPIGQRLLGVVGFNFARLLDTGVEAGARVVTLQAWTLRYSDDDMSLIRRLGGEQRAVTSLCAVHRVMEIAAASHSEQSNYAFVRLPERALVAIHWFVNGNDEWVIGAAGVPHPHLDIPAGSRVFGRAIVEAAGRPQ